MNLIQIFRVFSIKLMHVHNIDMILLAGRVI